MKWVFGLVPVGVGRIVEEAGPDCEHRDLAGQTHSGSKRKAEGVLPGSQRKDQSGSIP